MDYFVSSMKVHKVGISYLISQRQGSGNLANISKASEIVIMEAEWLLLPVWQQRCMQFLDIRLIVLAGGGALLIHIYWSGVVVLKVYYFLKNE